MSITLSEIAAHAGVSPATASRVLNGRPGVNSVTRRKVMDAADLLGYARPTTLQARRVGLIGVVIADLGNPIFPVFAQAIERALPPFGYNALLSTRRLGAPGETASIQLLQENGVAGIMFLSGIHSDSLADTSHYQDLRDQGVPLAFINGLIPDFDATFVADDEAAGMVLAVRHLLALGHRHIGIVIGSTRYTPSARKLAGFQRAVRQHSREAVAEVYFGDYSVESGRAAAVDLISRGCTGIIAASDFTALGIIRGTRRLGLRVPEDISVIGYDGAPIMAFTGPPLTTVKQSVDALAGAAVQSLVQDIEGRPRPRTELLFQPELIVRDSTDAAPDSPR